MPEALKRIINIISLLPWIWEKSATRLAFFLLNANSNYIDNFIKALQSLQSDIVKCSSCHSITDKWRKLCNICSNENRNKNLICVVEEYLDMRTIEESQVYDWVYHILWWAISPVNWVFVWDLNFKSLFERIEKSNERIELIIATNPNIEWEATSIYIKEQIEKKWLKSFVKITKLSRWLSSGYLEYADNMTIINSIKERKEF